MPGTRRRGKDVSGADRFAAPHANAILLDGPGAETSFTLTEAQLKLPQLPFPVFLKEEKVSCFAIYRKVREPHYDGTAYTFVKLLKED
jgi:hypothetical protein